MTLRQDALLGAVIAILACLLIAFLPAEMSPDGWYALLGGDVIVHHGLPHHDWLTVWGRGREWVDQQWLAQLAYYGLYALGGLRLALLFNAFVVVASVGAAVALGRAQGGSAPNVLWIAALAAGTIGLNSSALRPQTLALPLFVALTWLLVTDSRAPSRRVLWALPLLALWANLHGSAALGMLLVLAQVAATSWANRSVSSRGAVLAVLAPVMLLASPYTVQLIGYYRTILFNSEFSRVVPDWMPTALSPMSLPFYALALGSIMAVGRAPKALTLFERSAFVVLLALAIEATRGITWFTLFALIVVPRMCGATDRSPRGVTCSARRGARATIFLAVTAPLLACGIVVSRGSSWFTTNYPVAAARAADAAAGPHGQVFANGLYGDWLLLVQPVLRGRIAYDARFEILPPGRIGQAVAVSIGRWDTPAILHGYDVLVLRPQEDELRDQVVGRWGWRQVHADGKVVVLARAPTPHAVG